MKNQQVHTNVMKGVLKSYKQSLKYFIIKHIHFVGHSHPSRNRNNKVSIIQQCIFN